MRGRKMGSSSLHSVPASQNRFSVLRSNHGFTLVEVAITSVVAVIGIFAITTIFSDLIKIQKKSMTVQLIAQMRSSLISAIANGENTAAGLSAWQQTIGDITDPTGNPVAICLRDSLPCAKDVPTQLNVKGIDGNELFYSRTATRGFTFDGQLCNTYSAAARSDDCKLRWEITWEARCPGTTTLSCVNPVVEVSGQLLYRPDTSDLMHGQLNTAQYAFAVRRGEKTNKNEPVVVSYLQPDALGESIGAGQGCYLQWFQRSINTIVSDPGSNVVTPLVAPGTFTLKAGTYECRIQAPAFKNGGNKIRMVGTGVYVESGIVSASLMGESVTVTLQANITLGAPTALSIEHYCYQKPSLAPNAASSTATDNFMLGVPVSDAGSYLGTTFTIVSCLKTSG